MCRGSLPGASHRELCQCRWTASALHLSLSLPGPHEKVPGTDVSNKSHLPPPATSLWLFARPEVLRIWPSFSSYYTGGHSLALDLSLSLTPQHWKEGAKLHLRGWPAPGSGVEGMWSEAGVHEMILTLLPGCGGSSRTQSGFCALTVHSCS